MLKIITLLFLLFCLPVQAYFGELSQPANKIMAGPSSGGSGPATFRALVGADLPNPGASSLGGIQSYASVSHQFLTQISTSGVVSSAQPAFTDLSGSIAAAQMVALPSADIYVGNGSSQPAAVAMSGDATLANTGALTIAANSVSNAKLAQMPTLTIKGNNTGGTANALDLTVSQVNTILGDITTLAAVGAVPNANSASISGNTLNLQPFDSTHPGVVTASGGGSTNFLRADGSWAVPAGGGSGSINYFSGYMSGGSSWSATSSTFVDGTNTGGNTLTTIYSSGITVAAAASNVAGLTITPATSSDVFEVTATSAISDNGTTFIEAARLFDGTTDLGHSGAHLDSGNIQAGIAPITIDAIWAPATTSPVTIKIQLNGNDGGSAQPIVLGSQISGIRGINWIVKQIH